MRVCPSGRLVRVGVFPSKRSIKMLLWQPAAEWQLVCHWVYVIKSFCEHVSELLRHIQCYSLIYCICTTVQPNTVWVMCALRLIDFNGSEADMTGPIVYVRQWVQYIHMYVVCHYRIWQYNSRTVVVFISSLVPLCIESFDWKVASPEAVIYSSSFHVRTVTAVYQWCGRLWQWWEKCINSVSSDQCCWLPYLTYVPHIIPSGILKMCHASRHDQLCAQHLVHLQACSLHVLCTMCENVFCLLCYVHKWKWTYFDCLLMYWLDSRGASIVLCCVSLMRAWNSKAGIVPLASHVHPEGTGVAPLPMGSWAYVFTVHI